MSERSIASLLQHVESKPKDAKAHFELARLLDQDGDLDRALQSYERVIKLAPRVVEAYFRTAHIYLKRHDLAKAVMVMKKALKVAPREPKIYFSLGVYEESRSNIESALKYFDKALSINPQYTDAEAGRAAILIYLGRTDEALAILDRLLALPEPPYRAISVFPRIARKYDQVPRAIGILENALQDSALSDNARADLEFSLGNLYDKQKAFDTAFTHYARANTLKNEAYSAPRLTQWLRSLRETFSAGNLAGLASSGCDDQTPVFIVGMPRSGTSLLEQILCAHPQIAGAGELPFVQETLDRHTATLGTPSPALFPKLTSKMLRNDADNYLRLLRDVDGKARYVTDKMPGNFMHLGLIQMLFPNCRVIYCKRDAMDNCLSNYFQNYGSGHGYCYNLTHVGHYYREHEKLMAHWKSVLSIPILQVKYEDVVDDFRGTIGGVLEFLNLDWHDNCENFYRIDRSVATNSYDQVRQPLYKKSVARWQSYEKHLGELQNALSMGMLEMS